MSFNTKEENEEFTKTLDLQFSSLFPNDCLPANSFPSIRLHPLALANTHKLLENNDSDFIQFSYVRPSLGYKNWQDFHEVSIDKLISTKNETLSQEILSQDNGINNGIIKDIKISKTPNTIDDLLMILNENPLEPGVSYNIDLKTLHHIKPELVELNNMIGLSSLKTNIVEQILYYFQRFDDTSDYKHIMISGSPGTGKTEIAKILGRLYSKMGIFKTKHANFVFKKVTRGDLVAGYLGQTAIKTNRIIQESLGGVLFIDEAYYLGCNRNTSGDSMAESNDSFSKECADTLCESLSHYKDDLMVIIAGYEKELMRHFFTLNRGLESRFNWRFTIEDYTATELYQILLKKIRESGWTLETADCVSFFEKNKKEFQFNGRDIEVLLFKMKISHSKRVFGTQTAKKELNNEDLENGYKIYIQHKKKNEDSEKQILKESISYMYC